MNSVNDDPSFFLVTGELSDPQVPTACWPQNRLRNTVRSDYMLVRIGPAILGQAYGLGSENIEQLILSARLSGTTLFPIREWPCHVYVMGIKNFAILSTLVIGEEDVEMISWGTLHKTKEEASRVAVRA